MARFNVTYGCGCIVARTLTINAETAAYVRKQSKRPCRFHAAGMSDADAKTAIRAHNGDADGDVKAALKARTSRNRKRNGRSGGQRQRERATAAATVAADDGAGDADSGAGDADDGA